MGNGNNMRKEEIYTIGYPAKEAYQPLIEFIMEYANKGDKILDVGGGEGAYSATLNEKGFSTVCIDINKSYIKKAKKRGVESCVMDAANLSVLIPIRTN